MLQQVRVLNAELLLQANPVGYGIYGHAQPAEQSADGTWFWGAFLWRPENKDATIGWYVVRQPRSGASTLVWTTPAASGALARGLDGLYAHVADAANNRRFDRVPDFVYTAPGTGAPVQVVVDEQARAIAADAQRVALDAKAKAEAAQRSLGEAFDAVLQQFQQRLDVVAQSIPTEQRIEEIAWNKGVSAAFAEVGKQIKDRGLVTGTDVLQMLESFVARVSELATEAANKVFSERWNAMVGKWDVIGKRWTDYTDPRLHNYYFSRFVVLCRRAGINLPPSWDRQEPDRY